MSERKTHEFGDPFPNSDCATCGDETGPRDLYCDDCLDQHAKEYIEEMQTVTAGVSDS